MTKASRDFNQAKESQIEIMLPDPFRLLLAKFTMHASIIRHNLGGLVPPKIATPKLVVCTFFFLKILAF